MGAQKLEPTPKPTFRPTLFGTALMVVGVSLFLSLAWWQYQRAQYKRDSQISFDTEMARAPIDYTSLDSSTSTRFKRTQLSGQYLPQTTVLIDNIVHEQQAGYQVITAFQTEKGQTETGDVLSINRGWVPLGSDRNTLPTIQTPAELVTIIGRFDHPRSKPLGLNEDFLSQAIADQRWPWFELDAYRLKTGLPLTPLFVSLEPGEPGAAVAKLPIFDANIGMHIGYMIQWAAFALAAIVIWLMISRKQPQSNTDMTP